MSFVSLILVPPSWYIEAYIESKLGWVTYVLHYFIPPFSWLMVACGNQANVCSPYKMASIWTCFKILLVDVTRYQIGFHIIKFALCLSLFALLREIWGRRQTVDCLYPLALKTSQKWLMLQRGWIKIFCKKTTVCCQNVCQVKMRNYFKIMTHHSSTLSQLITSSPSLMPKISTRCAFSYIAIWMRKPCDK